MMADAQIKVVFLFGEEKVEVEGYSNLNILAHAQLIERSLRSRCGGQCECGTCRIELVEGTLSPAKKEEIELLKSLNVNGPSSRLACQSFPESSRVVVRVPQS